jgi:hypothetical protein
MLKTYIHEDDPFDIIFQRDRNYQEVIHRIDQIRDSSKFSDFIDWQFKRKKAFLKEKNEKQGIEEIEGDEDEDELSKYETE